MTLFEHWIALHPDATPQQAWNAARGTHGRDDVVLHLWRSGHTHAQIAEAVGCSARTVSDITAAAPGTRPPSIPARIRAHLEAVGPCTTAQIREALGESAASTVRGSEVHGVYVSDWVTSRTGWAAVWARGDGPSVKRPAAKQPRRRDGGLTLQSVWMRST